MSFDHEKILHNLKELHERALKLSQKIENRSWENYKSNSFHNNKKQQDLNCTACEALNDVQKKKECLKQCRKKLVPWESIQTMNEEFSPDVTRLKNEKDLNHYFFEYQKHPEKMVSDYENEETKEKTLDFIVELMNLPISPITLPDETWHYFLYILSLRTKNSTLENKKSVKKFVDVLELRKHDYTPEAMSELAKKLHRHDHDRIILSALKNDGFVL